MQSVSGAFTAATGYPIRKVKASVLASFPKTYNSVTSFFTIGTSTIGGTDIIRGVGNVLQEWDKYNYTDYSQRVIDVEYDREYLLDPNVPLIMATADITFDNTDDYFTPSNTRSPIYGNILPQRPFRIALGFDSDTCPIFVGVSDGLPIIDEKAKTAKFHCIDFLYSLINVPLDNDVIYVSQRTDQIISSLFVAAGLSASQLLLDIGSVTIPFAYFAKGSKLGDALQQIVQAELGRLYMNEYGIITFENRSTWATAHQNINFFFNKSNVLEMETLTKDNIINVCEVNSLARTVEGNQSLWKQTTSTEIPAGSSVDIFADFQDSDGALPVTSVDSPVYVDSATTSYFITNTASDGSGTGDATSVTLTASSTFSTSYKMTFTNSNSVSIWISQIQLYGTPARISSRVYVRKEDTTSTALFDEKVVTINNDYIQDEGAANSIAQIVISDQAGLTDRRKMLVKGVPNLQIADLVAYNDNITGQTYSVIRINGILNSSGFRQNITVAKRNIASYFRIGLSTIGGSDTIAP